MQQTNGLRGYFILNYGAVSELVYETDLKSVGFQALRVRVPSALLIF